MHFCSTALFSVIKKHKMQLVSKKKREPPPPELQVNQKKFSNITKDVTFYCVFSKFRTFFMVYHIAFIIVCI